MAKFNKKSTNRTKNRSGFSAYKMSYKDRLVTAALTTMLGEPKFYGSTDQEIVRLGIRCAKRYPEFLYHLACYTRNVGNLRSASHVLTAIIAHDARKYTRAAVRNVVVRPDDITEIMACYESLFGKPFPNALKREIAQVIQDFDEYQLAKYKGTRRAIKLRDVIRITHPVPKDKKTEELLSRLLHNRLETPYTWETELSMKGNSKEVWNELIASGKVGYMALLRNLGNIIKAEADIEPVLKVIEDPERIKKSRQLPFRFFSAYRTLKSENLLSQEIHKALESALTTSIGNMETIPGRSLIAVDCSASMSSTLSKNSTVRCCDLSALLGAMASRLCEEATVLYFNCGSLDARSFNGRGYKVAHYGKNESILKICDETSCSVGGTDMQLPLAWALERDQFARQNILYNIRHKKNDALRPFDRIIYLSDNECNEFCSIGSETWKNCQALVEEYRKEYNENFWVHAVDLQGYGTQQFCGKKFNVIAGWSETVLPFILLAERGISTLTKTIEEYDPDAQIKGSAGAAENSMDEENV